MGFKEQAEKDFANVFYNEKEFAESALYLPSEGTPYKLKVVFDDKFYESQPEGPAGATIQSAIKSVRLPQSFLKAEPGPGDRITVLGATYLITQSQPIGHGETRLFLEVTA